MVVILNIALLAAFLTRLETLLDSGKSYLKLANITNNSTNCLSYQTTNLG